MLTYFVEDMSVLAANVKVKPNHKTRADVGIFRSLFHNLTDTEALLSTGLNEMRWVIFID